MVTDVMANLDTHNSTFISSLNSAGIINLFGQIEDEMTAEIMNSLIILSESPDQDITIYINSDGGDLYCMFAIHDLMRSLNNRIITIGLGRVMSAAVVLLAAGDERHVMPNTTIMMHEPSISEYGVSSDPKVGDMGREHAHLDDLKKQMYKLLSVYTGQSLKRIAEDLGGKDHYLNAKEAKKYGLVDHVNYSKS